MISPLNYLGAMWVMRAGKQGEAHDLFLNLGLIALSDAQLGDLLNLAPSRNTFYAAYREKHPHETRRGSTGIGGKFYRFVHEVQIGDSVLYPSQKESLRLIYIGRIVGSYHYDLKGASKFPHQRPVDWQYSFSKSFLSEFAERELGAARTFFKFKRHHEEIKGLINDGKAKAFVAQNKVD